MKVLFPIAEAAPLYKIGGLGDVAAALPKELTALGVDVRIALPLHPEITLPPAGTVQAAQFPITYDGNERLVTAYLTSLPGTSIPVYLFEENTYLSDRTDASDNHADKFAVFSLAVSTWIANHSPYWQPHLIHCHDWHTALIPVILKHLLHKPYKTMITIHNLAYQGVTTTPVAKHLSIPADACQILRWDQGDGDTNILLEGLLHADAITTVSPTYAKEILTMEYGEKINHILESRQSRITGVLNGIDTDDFNPETDRYVSPQYSLQTWMQGKQQNRMHLQRELQLPTDDDPILIGFVGRVDPYQKGIGLIIQALHTGVLPPKQCQFVFLGTGDPTLEQQLHAAADGNPLVRIITRFDESLARRIYAASHLCLIPSRFEPCGLVQLIAQRYGCLPVARATGGLKDTIVHGKTGFLFSAFNSEAMIHSLSEAIDAVKSQTYEQLVMNSMQQPLSWHASAKKYVMLYEAVR